MRPVRAARTSRARDEAAAVPAGVALAAAPRPGRAIPFFGARSRGADLPRIARDLIEQNRAALGLAAMPGSLRIKREFGSLGGWHLRFEQVVNGAPVFGSEVSAHVAKDGRPLLVQADVYPVEGVAGAPAVAAGEALASAREFASDEEDAAAAVDSKAPQLVVLPQGRRGLLAWRVDVRTEDASLRVFVDAQDGAVVRADSLRCAADGAGAVFDPNPVYELRDGTLKDNGDRDSSKLQQLRAIVKLPHLDGTGYLRGRWADLTPTRDAVYAQFLDFTSFTRADPGFEQGMVYYHMDRAQQRLQDLGFDDVNAEPQRADAHALAQDQSYYDPFDDEIRFGDGGVDDAEDADIIRHEYGHAIQFAQVPDWGVEDEGSAMGEGFGDFHAVSWHTGDPALDPLVGSWDAVSYSKSNPPYLRRVDQEKRYPESIRNEPHADGEIWSRFLWDLRALVGNDTALRLAVEAHFVLTPSARFVQGANAVLIANEALRDGADDIAIRNLLDARGLRYTVPLAHPPADDAFEENDDIAHAAPLAPGFQQGLVASDDDWFRLDVPRGRRFHVTAEFDPDAENVDIAVYREAGASAGASDLLQTSAGAGGTESVDASAGAEDATFFLRVYDGTAGTHIAGYTLHVADTDLLPLAPGRAAIVRAPARVPSAFAFVVPAAKVGAKLRVATVRRKKTGALADLRLVSPTGTVLVDFGDRRVAAGARASIVLGEPGTWIVEVRSRDTHSGDVKLRADYR